MLVHPAALPWQKTAEIPEVIASRSIFRDQQHQSLGERRPTSQHCYDEIRDGIAPGRGCRIGTEALLR